MQRPRPFSLPAKYLAALLLAAGTLLAFAGVVRNGFIDDFDDDEYVTGNPHVVGGLTAANLAWAFTAFHSNNWHPLTWVSLQLDAACFGPGAWGFHCTNLLLHTAATLLLFAALLRMTGAVWRSAVVAGLFGVHPLHVESVAWVAERKDVLAALLWCLTLFVYAGYARRPALARHLGVVACVALGLLAKPMLVTLPCVLLLLDFWPLGRFAAVAPAIPPGATPRRTAPILFLLAEKVPLLALAFGGAALTVAAQQHIVQDLAEFSLPSRIGNALVSCVVYLAQAVYPVHLGFFYPHPHGALPWWQVGGAAVLLVIVSIAAILQVRSRPYLLVGWLWYLGTLVPVLGIVQVGLQAHADRYTYIPLVGIFLAGVWGTSEAMDGLRLRTAVKAATAGAVLLVCIVLTMVQVSYWYDSPTLWQHTLEVTDANFLAHFKLGMHCLRADDLDAAASHLETAHDLRPQTAAPLGGLAQVRKRQGRLDDAITLLRLALEKDPSLAATHRELASDLLLKGQWQEAAAHFQESLRVKPHDPSARLSLAFALVRLGRLDDAAAACAAALGDVGDAPEAPALQGEVLHQLGQVRARQGDAREALNCFRQAVEAVPRSARFRCSLALALARAGAKADAERQYQEALRLERHWPQRFLALARTLATHPDENVRDGLTAIDLATAACDATGSQRPADLDTLAAAYAEAGRFDDACATERRAILQAASGPPDLLPALRDHLQLFQDHRPLRKPFEANSTR
jgi:Flp pilus assembly protein TadD